jgi:acetyl-CoA carboxylase biotin carboxylase subunit
MKILVANRGEIAVRIIRACREMGLSSVAVYSDCDRNARHVREADQAFHIGPSEAAASYLRMDALLEAAWRSGADAVHPGYGFLAENAAFARACRDHGLTFIGPSSEAVATMGSKTAAREAAIRAGVAVVPGSGEALVDGVGDAETARIAQEVGYPLVVKAVAGGGGKGMRVVDGPSALADAIRTARSEAGSAFGNSAVYFERRIAHPRHIEIQLLGDEHGTVIPFVERECSIQRRHQKVVEESPSMAVTPELRRRMAAAAAAVARAVNYTSAGTIEFLLDERCEFFFLEMNTRLQVEHPVTEMVTAIDLVQWQIRIARGERLDIDPERALVPLGHAIECRIYAEDPASNFAPATGKLALVNFPAGPDVRVDHGTIEGQEISASFDPMIAKVIGRGDTREEAIRRTRGALRETVLLGLQTNAAYLEQVLAHPAFAAGETTTSFLDEHADELVGDALSPDEARVLIAAAAMASPRFDHRFEIPAPLAAMGEWRP